MAEDPKDFLKRMSVRAATEPDDSASILEVTPRNVLLLTGAARARHDRIKQTEGQLVLENINEHRVFFYPGASLDWEPLHRLTHQCDTFVFCDWGTNAEAVTGDFGLPGLATEFIVPLSQSTVRYLANDAPIHPWPWTIVMPGGGQPVRPWGKYARLVRTVGNEKRTIHFFYLGIEGVTAFFNLFTPVQAAPQTICLKGVGGFAGNWTNFHDWDRPLGQLVRLCNVRPTYLITDGGRPESWPYKRLVQRFHGWGSAYVQEFQTPPLQRKVIVRRGLLTPEAVAGCEALVLPIPLYLDHRNEWPVHAQILLLAPPDQEGQLPDHPAGVHFIGRRHAPLGHILQSVTEKCAELGVHRVSSIGIGYEDEGPELDKWRQAAGAPLELTIYCEHEGDVVSFGPYADEIQ